MKTPGFVIATAVCLMTSALCPASPVGQRTASLVARNFFYENNPACLGVPYDNLIVSETFTESRDGLPLLYIFNLQGGGYVMVSATDAAIPVPGYSRNGHYTATNQPENFNDWKDFILDQIESAIPEPTTHDKTVSAAWKHLTTDNPAELRQGRKGKSVEPLLISDWDQGKFYNGMCPADAGGPGGHVYAGCVATAMGQLMYYFRYPEHGIGSYTYNHPVYGTLSADFGNTTYHWNEMLNSINTGNDAIATLLFHLGVSVDMDYGPTGSGMWNHKAAYSLRTYFRYSPETRYVFRDSTNLNWDSLIFVHLDRRIPMYYAGWAAVGSPDGHAFIVDGYQDSSYFHFNWGWSGSFNGYFYLNQLNPGGNNFNFAQELIINCYPDTLSNFFPAYCAGSRLLTSQSGTFEDGSSPVKDYADNSDCSWLIAPQVNPEDSVSKINLTFNTFSTEPSNDVVKVYDGGDTTAALLGTCSGNSVSPLYTSSGNKLLVTFHSNGTVTGPGFFATYHSIMPEFCDDHTLQTPNGTLTDGSGAKNYASNALCTWTLDPGLSKPLNLAFTSFSTEPVSDFVEVYDLPSSQLLGRFSGNYPADSLPPVLTAPSGQMYLIFKTNASVTAQGWEATYYTTNQGLEDPQGGGTFRVFPNPFTRNFRITFSSAAPEGLRLTLTDLAGKVLYEENFRCEKGPNEKEVMARYLPPGIYFLGLSGNALCERRAVISQ